MKDFITNTLVKLHETCSVDQYGQVSRFTFLKGIFGKKEEEVIEYITNNKDILTLNSYGGRVGIYKAYNIIDKDIRNKCSRALRKNENYINNTCSW